MKKKNKRPELSTLFTTDLHDFLGTHHEHNLTALLFHSQKWVAD